MKRFLFYFNVLLFCFIFSLDSVAQDKIEWLSFEEAIAKNEKEPKKFLIDMWTTWCGWCKKMEATTFSHPEIVKIVNTYYYPVKINAETKDTMRIGGKVYINEFPERRRNPHQIAIALMQGKMSYPTIVYLDEEVNMLQPVAGYQSAKNIEPILMFFAENKYREMDWASYQKNFNSIFDQSQ